MFTCKIMYYIKIQETIDFRTVVFLHDYDKNCENEYKEITKYF